MVVQIHQHVTILHFSLETDILFGNRQGLTTLLVFSGATSEKTLDTVKQAVRKNTAEKDLLPNYCIKDVQHLVQLIHSYDKTYSQLKSTE